MALCALCEQTVAMPFRCKLCLLQYCERHRLPENHQCPNLDVYNTDEYRKYKSSLRDQSTSSFNSEPISSNQISWKSQDKFSGITRGALFGGTTDYWTSGDKRYDMIYLALIVATRNVLYHLESFRTPLSFLVQILFFSFILGSIGFMSILYFREKFAMQYGVTSQFYFSKLFVVLTLLMSLVSGVFNSRFFAIFIPGLFVMLSAAQIQNTYNVAVRSAFLFLGFWFLFSILLPNVMVLSMVAVPPMLFSSILVGESMLHLGIFTLFTEYKTISYWNRKMLVVIIILYIIAFFVY